MPREDRGRVSFANSKRCSFARFFTFFFLLSFLFLSYIYKEERISGTDEFLDRRLNLFLFFFEGENSKSEILLVKKGKIPNTFFQNIRIFVTYNNFDYSKKFYESNQKLILVKKKKKKNYPGGRGSRFQ